MAAQDLGGYLSPLSKDAQVVERQLATAALKAPISNPELVLTDEGMPVTAHKLTGAGVDFTYTYLGLPDNNLFRTSFTYTLEKQKGRWKVTSSQLDPAAKLPFWATGPVAVSRSTHFVALHRPGLSNARTILESAEDARKRLEPKLATPLDPVYLILLARDENEYAEMTTRVSPVSAIAQAETSFEVTPHAVKVQSRQVIVNLKRLKDGGTTEEVFQHELAHIALAGETRPFTPAWVGESAAMYLAGTRPVEAWRNGAKTKVFDGITFAQLNGAPALGMHDLTGQAASYEYAYAAGAAWYLIETFGAARYWEFYKSFAKVPASEVYQLLPNPGRPGSIPDPAVNSLAVNVARQNLRKVFGLSEAQLDLRVRAWISKQ